MKKDTFYFQHDYNATSDPKIQAMLGVHGGLGYGLYWRIIEMLHEQPEHTLAFKKYIFMGIAQQMGTSVEQVLAFVEQCCNDFELLSCNKDIFWCERVNTNISKRHEIVEKRREAGKISASKRAEYKNNTSTSVEQVPTSVQQNPTKEIKGKEIKVNNNNITMSETSSDSDNIFHSIPHEEIRIFEEFRKAYPGVKRGLETELKHFKTKHPKTWKSILPILSSSLRQQISHKNIKIKNREFVPEWKNLQTYINNSGWEEQFGTSTTTQESSGVKKATGQIRFGAKEN